jgi:hypothetical protein
MHRPSTLPAMAVPNPQPQLAKLRAALRAAHSEECLIAIHPVRPVQASAGSGQAGRQLT